MIKTPEQYFEEKDLMPEVSTLAEGEYTDAERAFLQKYLGLEDKKSLAKMGLDVPAEVLESSSSQGGVAGAAAMLEPVVEEEPELADVLKKEPELQLVSFFLDQQEFTVPINVVQEVIRFMPPTKLPAAPYFIAGIINLRGRVTPLVRLRDLLGVRSGSDEEDNFIVVCRRKGLQLGLMISTVATMYRVEQERIEWGIESHLGINVEFVSGLMKKDGEQLIGIISVDRIVDSVLKS